MRQSEASCALDAEIEVPVPEGLALFPFQKAAVYYAWQLRRRLAPGCLMAQEMGLGKTPQAIAFRNLWIEAEGSPKTLIICPSFLKLNWKKELSTWSLEGWQGLQIVEGRKPCDFGQVTLMSYAVVSAHKEALDAADFDLIVCDESHYLKNGRAMVTKKILGSGKEKKWPSIPRKYLLLMSGTPMPNRPEELWTTVRALGKGSTNRHFRQEWWFKKRYCFAGTGWGGKADFSGSRNLNELRRTMRASFMTRHLKRDVLKDLPEKVRQVIPLPRSEKIKKQLNATTREFEVHWEELAELEAKAAAAAKARNDKEYAAIVHSIDRQVTGSFDDLSALRLLCGLEVLPFAIKHLHNEIEGSDEKFIVFAHHHEILDALEEALHDYGVVHVDGRVPMDVRHERVERFQNDPSVRCFIGGIRACGVGLTLTAASRIVFVESDWVPGVVTQAEDRAHRIGQEEVLLVQHLVLEGSIGARMIETCVKKQDVADKTLDTPSTEKAARKIALPPAAPVTRDLAELIHNAIRRLAVLSDDKEVTGKGFSRSNLYWGRRLAAEPYLTPSEAERGQRILLRHKPQVTENEWKELTDGIQKV